MNETIGTGGVTHEELALLHDGELSGAEEQELRAQVEGDPLLRAELERLEYMQRLVAASLERSAAEVPQARFEQIWEEVDRAIDRDVRLQEAAGDKASIWARLRAMGRPMRWPVVAAAAAALAVWWTVGPRGVEHPAKTASETSTIAAAPSSSDATATRSPAVTPEASAARQRPLGPPKPVEAEIHEVEFGGRAGHIAQSGTVTVLYVEDDLQPSDNERSL